MLPARITEIARKGTAARSGEKINGTTIKNPARLPKAKEVKAGVNAATVKMRPDTTASAG